MSYNGMLITRGYGFHWFWGYMWVWSLACWMPQRHRHQYQFWWRVCVFYWPLKNMTIPHQSLFFIRLIVLHLNAEMLLLHLMFRLVLQVHCAHICASLCFFIFFFGCKVGMLVGLACFKGSFSLLLWFTPSSVLIWSVYRGLWSSIWFCTQYGSTRS